MQTGIKQWENCMQGRSYETYHNIVYNHIIPAIGSIKMTDLKRSHIQKIYNETAGCSVSVARLVKTVINTSMKYALNKKIISVNPALEIELPKYVGKKSYHARKIDDKKTLNIKQILTLIEASKDTPNRTIPIPDYVFEAILEQRKLYEKNRRRRPAAFQDLDYICCSSYGRPRSKDFHWKHYKNLLEDNNLPDIRWHDLRSTFCTILLKNNFNPKAV